MQSSGYRAVGYRALGHAQLEAPFHCSRLQPHRACRHFSRKQLAGRRCTIAHALVEFPTQQSLALLYGACPLMSSPGDVHRTQSRKAQVFFHVSAVEGLPVAAGGAGDLSAVVRPGQHVEFEVQEADGRLQAVGVRFGIHLTSATCTECEAR